HSPVLPALARAWVSDRVSPHRRHSSVSVTNAIELRSTGPCAAVTPTRGMGGAGDAAPPPTRLWRDLRDESVRVAELRGAGVLRRGLVDDGPTAVEAVLVGVHRRATDAVAAVRVDEPCVRVRRDERVVVAPELTLKVVLSRRGRVGRLRA